MSSRGRSVSFAVGFPEVWLDVEAIWPDGDAPENPTAEDVVKVMRGCGGVTSVAREWNLLSEIEVFGNHDASRATLR